jgi:hypothetical protein
MLDPQYSTSTGSIFNLVAVYRPSQKIELWKEVDNEMVLISSNGTSIPASQHTNNGRNTVIGDRDDCTNCSGDFTFYEVGLWEVAFSSQQIRSFAGPVVPGYSNITGVEPLLYHDFIEASDTGAQTLPTSGAFFIDKSGNGHNITPNGATYGASYEVSFK